MKTSKLIAYGIGGMLAGLFLEYGLMKVLQQKANKNRQKRRNGYKGTLYASASQEHGNLRSYLSKKQ